jgi:hypothetical protein
MQAQIQAQAQNSKPNLKIWPQRFGAQNIFRPWSLTIGPIVFFWRHKRRRKIKNNFNLNFNFKKGRSRE